jgi:16S rRNA (adenine1518-N6/adenine1519-N6)-dimethyltransferase
MSLSSPSHVRDVLAHHRIHLKKSLGQHFLVDEHILRKIAEETSPDDLVVEIGAGIGTLTQELARWAQRVIAVEIDARLIPLLQEHVHSHAHVSVVHQDFLTFDLSSVSTGRTISVVGNLPYYATAPILEKLVGSYRLLKRATLLVQLEVAEKLCATPGTRDASSITIFVQSFADVRKVARISRHVFFPRPEVDSALVRLEFLDLPRFRAPELIFLKVVRAAFHLRRKILRQSLTRSPFLKLSRQRALKALEQAQIDPKRRGETLTIEEFDQLAQALSTLL